MDIYTENSGIISTKWNREFIKNVGIFIFNKGELFNKRGVKLRTNGEEAGAAQEVLRQFLKVNGSGRRKENLCTKILWWNHQTLHWLSYFKLDVYGKNMQFFISSLFQNRFVIKLTTHSVPHFFGLCPTLVETEFLGISVSSNLVQF